MRDLIDLGILDSLGGTYLHKKIGILGGLSPESTSIEKFAFPRKI